MEASNLSKISELSGLNLSRIQHIERPSSSSCQNITFHTLLEVQGRERTSFLQTSDSQETESYWWVTQLANSTACPLLPVSYRDSYPLQQYTESLQVMQQYSDDIEMWDFEQILDNSPLTTLTADFARFKRRFANIFHSSSSDIPYIDSSSTQSVNTTAAATTAAAATAARLATSTSEINQDSNKGSMIGTSCHGSSHYIPTKPTSRTKELSKYKPNTITKQRSLDSNSITKQRSLDSNTITKQRSLEDSQLKCSTTNSAPTPAKRPTELPVVPHVVTDDYIVRMKTKGYKNSGLHSDHTRPKPEHYNSQPRLTRSYLEEYHDRDDLAGWQRTTESLIREWQSQKYQQELQNNSLYENRARANNKQRRGAVRFDNPYSGEIEPDSSAFYRREEPKAFLSQDNRFLQEDSWSSYPDKIEGGQSKWRGPPTPYPQKTDLHVGATHRGTHKFTPRHSDELQIEIGDSIHVLHEADDGWCMGINLTSESQGIFPSVYATDLEFYKINEQTTVKQPQSKLYKLHFLGSLEVNHHKGSRVLVDAIEKIILNRRVSKDSTTPPLCQLEISEAGVKMIDLTHKKRTHKLINDLNIDSACERLSKLLAFSKETKAVSNHFFSLKNVTFCGYHPDNPRYFGFITKHPTQRRFACHCYSSIEDSTQPIVDAVGEAFHNYYSEFEPFSSSSEELYLE